MRSEQRSYIVRLLRRYPGALLQTGFEMKKITMIGVFAFNALCASTAAQAQQEPGTVAVGITGGTEGIGPELSYRIDPVIGVRANATFLGFGHGVQSDGIEYHGHADLASGGIMVDLYPFRSGFYVSGGARINGNHGRLDAIAYAEHSDRQ